MERSKVASEESGGVMTSCYITPCTLRNNLARIKCMKYFELQVFLFLLCVCVCVCMGWGQLLHSVTFEL